MTMPGDHSYRPVLRTLSTHLPPTRRHTIFHYQMARKSRCARLHRTAQPERQLSLPVGDNVGKRPPAAREKIYREGFRVRVTDSGILIEAIDYHTKPLLLQGDGLKELGLALLRDDSETGRD